VYIKKKTNPNPKLENAVVELEGKPPPAPAGRAGRRGARSGTCSRWLRMRGLGEGTPLPQPFVRSWDRGVEAGSGSRGRQGRAPGSGPGILGPAPGQRYGLQGRGARGDGHCVGTWALLSPWGAGTPRNVGVPYLLAWVY